MLLKAGTYRFNDVLSLDVVFKQYISLNIGDADFIALASTNVGGDTIALKAIIQETPYPLEVVLYDSDFGWASSDNVINVELIQIVTIPTDTEVDDTFGSWYISNTNYNEVNAPVEDTIYTEKSSWYKSVADAIRNKKGTTAPILRDDFASEIESISVGEETPYYDGTVIIEKAESVLGLRRFKEDYSVISTTLTSDEEIWNEYGFSIEETLFEEGINSLGMACFVKVGDEDAKLVFKLKLLSDNSIMYISAPLADLDALTEITFNVTSTANSTVDEWLLANTEGVSV